MTDDHDTPAFDALAVHLSPDNVGPAEPPEPGDDWMEILTAIREGRTTRGEHVRTLAALGFDFETVADALDMTVPEVEAHAQAEGERLVERMNALREE